jgi:transcriptional regulator with XRE-family HTH domain
MSIIIAPIDADPRSRVNSADIYAAAKIKEARLSRKMSQEGLAEILGCSFQQIQKYEKGTNRVSIGRVFEIANALQYQTSSFLPPEKGDKPNLPILTRQEACLLSCFRKLTATQKMSILTIMDALTPE